MESKLRTDATNTAMAVVSEVTFNYNILQSSSEGSGEPSSVGPHHHPPPEPIYKPPTTSDFFSILWVSCNFSFLLIIIRWFILLESSVDVY